MIRTPCWLALLAVGVACTDFEQSTDFTVEADGFTFANFDRIAAPALLDSAGAQQLFGPTVCEPGTASDSACTLTPEAEYWALQVNRSMGGGRCEGLSAFSQALYAGSDSAEDYGGSRAADLDIESAGPRIAYWQATQFLGGVVDNSDELSGLELLRGLQQVLRLEGPVVRLGLVSLDDEGGPTGGHALTPYGIEERDDDAWDVLVYDPNLPGEDQRIRIDADADSWEYTAGEDPNGTYAGDLDDGNGIWVTPLAARTTPGQCLLCEGSSATGSTVLVQGPAQVAVSDCEGESVGYTAEGFQFEGDFGAVRPNYSGLWGDRAGLSFFVGGPDDLCVDANTSAPNEAEEDQLSMGLWRTDRRMAFVSGVAGVGSHQLASRAGGMELEYVTDVAATGPLVLSGESDDNSRLVVRVETDAAPQTLAIRLLPAEGDAIVDLGAASEQVVSLHLTRSRGLLREVFAATLDPQPAGANLRLLAGSWAGDGSPLTIEVDDDGDGSAERTLSIDDCQDPALCLPPSGDDGDAVDAADDNCANAFNPGQDDRDADGVGDACDACPDDPECVCPAGTWEDDADVGTPCAPCTAGEYCAGGADSPAACGGADFDHDLDPSTPCRACDDGFSSPDGLTCE